MITFLDLRLNPFPHRPNLERKERSRWRMAQAIPIKGSSNLSKKRIIDIIIKPFEHLYIYYIYLLYFHSEAVVLKGENGKFINNQHLKNMNTLQQSRQKVNIVMPLLAYGVFLLQIRKQLG